MTNSTKVTSGTTNATIVAGLAALAYPNMMINRQALFIADLDDFKLMLIIIITFVILPLLFFMKRDNDASRTPKEFR